MIWHSSDKSSLTTQVARGMCSVQSAQCSILLRHLYPTTASVQAFSEVCSEVVQSAPCVSPVNHYLSVVLPCERSRASILLTSLRCWRKTRMAKDLTKVLTVVTSVAFKHAACHSIEAMSAVSRIRAHSDMYEMDLLLDINSDLYPVDVSKAVVTTTLMALFGRHQTVHRSLPLPPIAGRRQIQLGAQHYSSQK